MAIVSGHEVSTEQYNEFAWHVINCDNEIGEPQFDVVCEPDGHVTVGCLGCHTILIDLYPEEGA